MKKRIKIVILCIIFTIIEMPIQFAYTKSEQKKDMQNQLIIKQNEQKNVKSEQKNILEEIDKLDEEILQCKSEISELNKKTNNLSNSIKLKEIEVKRLEKSYREKEEAFIERMVAIYEAGRTSYLDVLLSSDDIISFISNYYIIEELAEADNTMLNSIKQESEKIKETRDQLEIEKNEIVNVKKEIEEKNKKLVIKKSEKNEKLGSLNAKEKELEKEIEKYKEDIKNIEKVIKEYEKKQHNNSNSNYTGGKLGWPLEGYYTITSTYGYRIHPIYGYKKLHTGIDIGAPKGANFVAAENGIVISASYSGGYGNRVVISHGNELTTLYAHGTSILVKEGQKVKKGQPVLTVGSTGLSTGNHAHFEVRVNGSCVNPLEYLQ